MKYPLNNFSKIIHVKPIVVDKRKQITYFTKNIDNYNIEGEAILKLKSKIKNGKYSGEILRSVTYLNNEEVHYSMMRELEGELLTYEINT